MIIAIVFEYIKKNKPTCEMWYLTYSKKFGIAQLQLWFFKRFGIGIRWYQG